MASRRQRSISIPRRINPGDPEAAGLQVCYVAMPGQMMDLVKGDVAIRQGTADPTRSNAEGTLDAYFDGTDDRYSFPIADYLDETAPFTIVWEGILDAFVDSYPMVATWNIGIGSKPLEFFYTSDANYNDICLGWDTGSAVSMLKPASVALTAERHWGSWSYKGGTFSDTANHDVFLNGAACTGTTTSTFGTGTEENNVGGFAASFGDWNGSIRQVRVYNRIWSHADHVRFWHPSSRDSLFAPRRQRLWVGQSAAVSIIGQRIIGGGWGGRTIGA